MSPGVEVVPLDLASIEDGLAGPDRIAGRTCPLIQVRLGVAPAEPALCCCLGTLVHCSPFTLSAVVRQSDWNG